MRSSGFRFRLFMILIGLTVAGSPNSSVPAQDPARTTRRDPQPQVRYPLSAEAIAQDGVPRSRLDGPHLFHSKVIADTVRKYWVSVPAQYDPQQPACVLVFQDGARATNPNGVLRVNTVLENLIAKKQIPVTIGIYITPGQRGTEFPDSIGTGNPDNRDREYDVLNDSYARMLIEEILPEVGKSYNLTSDPAGRAIGGSSSGAICAFTVAWERPDQFRNVISMIGSYTNIHGGHVYPDLVRQADQKPIRIFLQDGIHDLRSPDNLERDWYLQNQKMVAALKEKNYDMAHVFGEGGHSDDHGGAILPQMLRWIWRDYPGIVGPTTDLVAEATAIHPEKVDPFPGFDSSAKIDPSGTYTWERRFGNTSVDSSLAIRMTDGTLSGTLEAARPDTPPVSSEIQNPVMEGNKLVFDVTTNFRDREVTSTYQGIVTDKGVTGWQMMDIGGQARDTAWSAARKSSAALLKTTNDLKSWRFELTGDGKGTMSVDGDAVVFETTKTSAENWHVQAYQTGVDLRAGSEYELTFKAQSSTGATILAMGIVNQPDWHNIGLQEEVYVGRTEREFSITFTANDVVEKNNRIGFVLGDSLGVVRIRQMSLKEK